ncbi:MAG: T9SS type A sorting domain-containing protein [Saprospiraceae bacterium]|nr:T9SS type A sorting domain-containing protein [Saprospiraceae bacterium]
MFPNPTRQWLNANFPASPFETNLSLFNTHGQCIHQTLIPAFSKEVALPVQGLPSGIYLVQHNVGGVIQTAKV